MKSSGHVTFPVREGWLHKGLKQHSENSEQMIDENIGDFLGIGRNMAESIPIRGESLKRNLEALPHRYASSQVAA